MDISVGWIFLPGLATIVNFSRKILSPTDSPVSFAVTAKEMKIMAIMHDTHRFLHFNLTHTGTGEDNHYVDISKLLSAANRRFYRQGMVYHIANIVFDDAQGDADIDVCTAPNTWNTQAAWRLGFEAWRQQQTAAARSIALDDLGPWSDFKVNLNSDGETDTDQAALIDVNGNTFSYGDWDMSVLQIPQDGADDPTEADIILMGNRTGTYPNFTQVSLLQELEKVLEVPMEDPALNNPSTSIYPVLSEHASDPEVLEQVVQDIEDDNDLPPYDRYKVMGAATAGSGRPSSPWVVRTCMIKGGSSTSSPVAAVGGFAAPCGLLMIETSSSTDGNSIGVTIELVPGEYKGVHAYPMRGGGY